jgi:uncharacterized membrane protein
MLATVIWIGGLAILTVFVIPVAQHALDKEAYFTMLVKIQRRLNPLAWFSVVILLASGMLQMSANPNYQGFLSIDSLWAGAILVKHGLFGLMVFISGYITWGIIPALQRVVFKQTLGKETPELESLPDREVFLLRLNLILGILVLALTALARAS